MPPDPSPPTGPAPAGTPSPRAVRPAFEAEPPSSTRLLWGLTALTLAGHLALAPRYGFFRDELYFLVCGQRLAWGYVDQPPFVAAVAALAQALFGTWLPGIRLFPALAAAGLVLLTGVFARRMGGERYAVTLACLAAALAPVLLAFGHPLTMNAFEPLFWTGCALCVWSLVEDPRPTTWLLLGALVGVGILNKHGMAFLVGSLLVGVAATPARRILASWWCAAAAGLATLLVLPHLHWQREHGWPMWELLRNGQLYKNVPWELGAYLAGQPRAVGPLQLGLALVGLWWLVRGPRSEPGRPLAIGFLVCFVLLGLLRAKAYYLTAAYPMLFAAGAVAVDDVVQQQTVRPLLVVLLVASGLLLAPLAVPVLSEEALVRYQAAAGLRPQKLERHVDGELPQHLADQHGWEELVSGVTVMWARLPVEEQARSGIYTGNYGEAAAIDILGRRWKLPHASSGHNSYFLWGPQPPTADVWILLGGRQEDHQRAFNSVTLAGHIRHNRWVMPYEDELPVFVARKPRLPVDQLWPAVKHYE